MTKDRILFVEDNMDTNELMHFFMKRNGYDTFLAVSGCDGVNAAVEQKARFDLDGSFPAEMEECG